MIDIVRVFEKFAQDKGMLFDYGTKATLNLLGGTSNVEIDLTKIYLLLERRKGTALKNNFGNIEGVTYTGYFFLVVNADFDLINFASSTGSKYENNIEPLLDIYKSFFNYFGCKDLVINSLEFQDVTDILDQNMDGLLINYSIFIPENYEL
jgi:hypothetical protein